MQKLIFAAVLVAALCAAPALSYLQWDEAEDDKGLLSNSTGANEVAAPRDEAVGAGAGAEARAAVPHRTVPQAIFPIQEMMSAVAEFVNWWFAPFRLLFSSLRGVMFWFLSSVLPSAPTSVAVTPSLALVQKLAPLARLALGEAMGWALKAPKAPEAPEAPEAPDARCWEPVACNLGKMLRDVSMPLREILFTLMEQMSPPDWVGLVRTMRLSSYAINSPNCEAFSCKANSGWSR